MATITCNRSDLFPVSATVTVHPDGQLKTDGGAPSGAAVASGTVGADGALSITDSDIVSGTAFILYAASTGKMCKARSTLDIQDIGGAIGTGDTTSGSASIANAAASAGSFREGQRIGGAGIPGGTTIVSISGNTLTLSAKATATASSVALVAEGAFSWQARVRRRRVALGTA